MFSELDKLINMNIKLAEKVNHFKQVKNTIIIYKAISFLIIIFMAYILTKSINQAVDNIALGMEDSSATS